MNLKGFKKVSEDENKATLKNDKGHSITLAKKGLSKAHLDGLSKLTIHAAEGADTEMVDRSVPPEPQAAAAPAESLGDAPPAPLSPEEQNDMQQAQQANASGQPVPGVAEAQPASLPTAIPANVGAPLTPQQRYDQAKNETFAKNAEEYGKQAALYDQDLANGHISPKTYQQMFNDKGLGGKIGTLFGLLVSGAGSGLAHQQSAVLDMMNKEIEQDFEAQKQNKSNAVNYYKANLEHQRTQAEVGLKGAQKKQTEAETLINTDTHSLNQMKLGVLHNMTMMNQKMPPEQQIKGQQLLDGVIKPAIANDIQQRNQRAAAQKTELQFQQENREMRLAESLGALPGGGSLAQAAEQRHYPGVPGEASRALTPADTGYIDSGQNFDKQLSAFTSWTKGHSGDLNPSDRKMGEAMAAELQGAYRQATNGGVFKEGEQNFISKIIDSTPTKFFNEIRVLPQLGVIAKDNQRRLNTKLQGLGFEGYPGYKETKWMNGVEYEKGPNGQAIPVKR